MNKHESLYIHICLSLPKPLYFSCSVVFNSLQPHEPQHTRLSCPSLTLGARSNSRPLSWWCHPTISPSIIPFSSCLKSFQASGSFPMSQLNPSKMTAKIKRRKQMNPQKQRKEKRTADDRQPQFRNGNPRRERKGCMGGGFNWKQTSACLRIPSKSQELRMHPSAFQKKGWVGLKTGQVTVSFVRSEWPPRSPHQPFAARCPQSLPCPPRHGV